MYTFVFLWTPALSPHGEHLPHGIIFACFMVRSSHLAQLSCSAGYLAEQGIPWLPAAAALFKLAKLLSVYNECSLQTHAALQTVHTACSAKERQEKNNGERPL